ncbi:flagellar hook-length control protein FliK [Azotobacter chroococcum]|uniref:Flagellar hook-length control protein FliK n=1 Tax=Azotobacter chroococcum TaxID=353 RepID=A0A4R1PRW2_9GAMM|nr:flagellar hook-length control protein FliK [Azotobacter chroococcum]TBV97525.1 flagellar hook-length control protein FliK [Azotobacter chroococcum]TCL28069.1 flagellar hook-length control protein FliK [Azotobacter chroococcum]
MDIIALPASPPSGAAAPAAPGPSPAAAGTGGGFARSLEQAASRQTADAAAAPQTRTETPAAAAGITQATGLPGLSVTPPASGAGTQKDAASSADERPEEAPADLAAMLLQAPLLPTPPAATAGATGPAEADIPDELQRIRSRLQAIERAGQLSFSGPAEAALASLPTQLAPSSPATIASATAVAAATAAPAGAMPSPSRTIFAGAEQSRPALPTPPVAAGQAGLAGSGQAGQAPAFAEGARAVHTEAIPDGAQASRPEALMEGVQASRVEPLTEGARTSHAASLAENIRVGDNLPPGLESTSGSSSAYPLAGSGPSASGPATTGSPAGANLTAPLASPDWQRGLGQHLLGLQQRGEQEIELHLHPAELGPLSISLKLGESGAQAQFLSAHPQVRAAVEQAIPQLREALAEQGIALGETSVGERQQQPRDERPGTSGRGAALAGGAGEESVPGLAESAAPPAVRLEGVDLYA